MKPFQITLKNEKLKQYDKIALFIILINLAIFVYLLLSTDHKVTRNKAIGGIILVLLSVGIDYYLRSVKRNEHSPFRVAAEFFITMTWIQLEYWWIAGLCGLLGLLYLVAKRPLLVLVLKEKILYPSFPKKQIAWSELNTFLLKDGLLTIDFKNHRFLQQMVDPAKTAVNEQEFNDFCRQQLDT